MSLNGKWISVKDLIWSTYRDLGTHDELPFSDIIEWTAEILNIVGHPDQYLRRIIGHESDPDLDFTNYRVKLPCDFHKLIQLAVDGFPAVYTGSTFHHLLDGDCCGLDLLGRQDGDTFTDNFGNVFSTNLGPKSRSLPLEFEINDNYITFNVKEGKLCMAYYAFPTDEEGFPLIPDDASYKQAVIKYVTMKIDYIRWRQQPDSNGLKALYEDAKKEYEWYIGQAVSKAKRPDMNKMEGLKNQMLRLRPRINYYDSFFREQKVSEVKKIK